jgi:hypothetical protein
MLTICKYLRIEALYTLTVDLNDIQIQAIASNTENTGGVKIDVSGLKFSVEKVDSSKLTETQKDVLGSQADTAVVVDVNVYVNGIRTGFRILFSKK